VLGRYPMVSEVFVDLPTVDAGDFSTRMEVTRLLP
jgi:hypothetical protein